MMNKEIINRTNALKWWNNLSSLEKTRLCDINTQILGKIRRWETLTGREIEIIYSNYLDKLFEL